MLQHLKCVPGDVEASLEIRVALFDAPPRLLFGAGDPVEARLGADRGDPCPQGVAVPARPTTEIEHDVDAHLQTSGPDFFQLFRHSSAEFLKVLDRRIIAVQACHPFVMRKADGRDALLELPSEGWSCRPRDNRGSGEPSP